MPSEFEGTLKAIFSLLLVTGGGGAVYAIIQNWPWAQGLRAEYKRILAGALAVVFGWIGFGGLVVLGYSAAPASVKDWLITLAEIGAALFTLSQGWHIKELRKNGV